MRKNVADKIEKLYELSSGQLMAEYTRLTGESYYTRNRKSLIRKIAWLYQTADSPPISQIALDRVDELVKDSKLRTKPPQNFNLEIPDLNVSKKPKLKPGTILTKTYNGDDYEVVVLDRGFLWNNKIFKSISAVAKAITGSHWNGNIFFGLK